MANQDKNWTAKGEVSDCGFAENFSDKKYKGYKALGHVNPKTGKFCFWTTLGMIGGKPVTVDLDLEKMLHLLIWMKDNVEDIVELASGLEELAKEDNFEVRQGVIYETSEEVAEEEEPEPEDKPIVSLLEQATGKATAKKTPAKKTSKAKQSRSSKLQGYMKQM